METVITVRVIPGSRLRQGPGTRDGSLLIRLNARAVEGAANAELVEVLARLFDIPKRNVTIVSGLRGRTKRVRIAGVEPAAIERTIARLA